MSRLPIPQRRSLIAAAGLAALPIRAKGADPVHGVDLPFDRELGAQGKASGWHEQGIPGVTANQHAVRQEAGRFVLEVRSTGSASSVVHLLPMGAADATRLTWRWRTDGYPAGAAFGRKSADDFAGRVYVMFDYPMSKVPLGQRVALAVARALHGGMLPAAALCYVWDPDAPVDMSGDSPYSARVRMIVVRSGRQTGRWLDESRDLRRDFSRMFGDEYGQGIPPILAVGLAADTDQTGSRVVTDFADVRLEIAGP
jgi:hypothetical protein